MARKQTTTSADAASPLEDLTFEQALTQLEAIVAQLEAGDLTLEQSLDLHTRGQSLAEFCAKQLDNVELKVRELSNE